MKTCAAWACNKVTDRYFCKKHWIMVPRDLRQAILESRPMHRYAPIKIAAHFVAEAEGRLHGRELKLGTRKRRLKIAWLARKAWVAFRWRILHGRGRVWKERTVTIPRGK